jgi:carbon storage regulator
MLVLSRKVGEKIIIGDNIVVQVLAVNGNRIRLGIEAPPSVGVWREECVRIPEWQTDEDAVLADAGWRERVPQKG